MRQPLICHCNFLEPGSVGASTLRHPSLVVIFSVIEDKMFLSMLGSLWEAVVVLFSLRTFHGVTRASVVDTRRCCTKKLTERSDSVDHPTDEVFFLHLCWMRHF